MPFFSSNKQDDIVLVELTKHQADLNAFVRSLMPGDPGADDVIQHANLVVWKKRRSFNLGTDFRAWLFSIARLEVLAHRKAAARKSWLVIDDDLTARLADAMATTTRETPYEEFRPALERCLSLLKPIERSVVERFYFDGESLKSIAATNQRSDGAMKVALHRIRATLRRCIEGRLLDPPETAS
ncbi:MAG: sigma-70 family RNA polymerase sigma factor [Verrucomicrobiae bacterium]|nr:sigma-70 family RNA polymerase sigma factor [Verrucomicrobiae bacterium]